MQPLEEPLKHIIPRSLLPSGLCGFGVEQKDLSPSCLKEPTRAAHGWDGEGTFHSPQHPTGDGDTLGPFQVAEPGAPLVPAANSPKSLLSRTAFSSRCVIALCQANPADGDAFSPASPLFCHVCLIPLPPPGQLPKHPGRERRGKPSSCPTRTAKPRSKKGGRKAQAGVRCLSPTRPLPVFLWGFDKSAFRLTK